jgi:hypothetical protein
VIATQEVTREMLREVFANPRTLRAVESLFSNLGAVPNELAALELSVAAAQAAADAAQSDADAAQATADDVDTRLTTLEADMAFRPAILYDQDADPPTVAYLCEADPGALTSAAVWRIQKLTFGVDGDVTIQWADGDPNFDNIADNRASLTYT